MKLKKNAAILLIMVVLCLAVLTSCGSNGDVDADTDADAGAEADTEASADAGEGKKTVVDQLGRTVELPEKVEKVSALHIYGAKMIFAMGQKEKIAYQLAAGGPDTEALAKVDEFYGSLPTVESSAHGIDNPEAMLELGVDVVFTNARAGEEAAESYQNAGMTAIAVSGETFEEVYETARIMSVVFDCPERDEEVIEFIEGIRGLVDERIFKVAEGDKPVVLVCGPQGVYTAAAADMFQQQMVETAGGINAGAELSGGWVNISAEDIVTWDPDFIFLASSFGLEDVESVLAYPALQTVKAVKNKQVYIFPSSLGWWDFPLPQSVLGIVWTAKTIHPELWEDVDMLEMADKVYEFLYGYTYTELGGVL
ncbi:MAG: ABC transporter substrate-binding protein [Firmicutes bacterium]|nr:ABC transporter substrate-binding protein [Bacillota bacterium]